MIDNSSESSAPALVTPADAQPATATAWEMLTLPRRWRKFPVDVEVITDAEGHQVPLRVRLVHGGPLELDSYLAAIRRALAKRFGSEMEISLARDQQGRLLREGVLVAER